MMDKCCSTLVIKKDGRKEKFDSTKIKNAVSKSANRVLIKLNENEYDKITYKIVSFLILNAIEEVSVEDLHLMVERSTSLVNKEVAESYRSYRNYKKTLHEMTDEVWNRTQTILYRGDKENSNADSTLVSTKQSLIRGELARQFYRHFFLTDAEREATKIGFVYNHDEKDRLFTFNCCLADVGNVMKGGFENANIWMNEPKTLDVACDVLGDIIMSMSAQQYGGFTVPHIDKILAPYCIKSHNRYIEEIVEDAEDVYCEGEGYFSIDMNKVYARAKKKVYRELKQGIQGFEIKLNTVASSRGDYPFVTFSFGAYEDLPICSLEREYAKMICEVICKVRKEGQGKDGYKKPVLFPKLNFLYIEHLHGENKQDEYLYDLAIECSAKAMYPKKIGA